MRYKNECARRIQRFWKNNKESIEYAKVRDYGHQVLAGRKERRRFSLLSYRRFMGDYLDVNGKSALGEELQSVCAIGCKLTYITDRRYIDFVLAEKVTFSSDIEVLVSKLGRSSKPSPRILVVVCLAQRICYACILISLAFRRRKLCILSSQLKRKGKCAGLWNARFHWSRSKAFR